MIYLHSSTEAFVVGDQKVCIYSKLIQSASANFLEHQQRRKNPIYEDDYEEDNMSERKLAVIFENTNPQIHDNNIPVKYDLLQNYPNPFNPTTNLEFGISELGFVTLKVYDILGKEVKTLVNEIKPAGTYIVVFDGSNLASGVYFYRIEAGEFREIKRMILLK